MKIEKVGLMTPGDMGQAVAMQIKARGFTVCTALDNRTERSRALAREAGLTDLGSIARLIGECDVEISKTLGSAGITPKVFQGAADIYRFVAATPLGKETPENRDKERSGKAVVQSLAGQRQSS